ncbi:MAG: excisionase family DNA-binding protein [bacterium]|nr:excisionase family DNA-binding protein [bacterium]
MRYQTTIELGGQILTDDEADTILDALEQYHPAIGYTDGNASVLITVPAESLRQAVTTGLALIATATDREPFGVAAMTEAAWDAREGFVPVPELIGADEAAVILGVSRPRIPQLVAEGKLPATKVGNSFAFARATVEALASRRVES